MKSHDNSEAAVSRRKGAAVYYTLPKGWHILEGTLTAPVGYAWINNRKSIFSPEYRRALLKIS